MPSGGECGGGGGGEWWGVGGGGMTIDYDLRNREFCLLLCNIAYMSIPFLILRNCHTKAFNIINVFEDCSF